MIRRAALLGVVAVALAPGAAPGQQRWALKVDPPAEPVSWPADYKPEVPTWRWPDACVFADQGGPFVAVGGHRSEWAVYDLRTGKPVGTVGKDLVRDKVALSGDGTRMAGYRHTGPGEWAAVVADTAAGKEAARATVRAQPSDFCFAGRDRVAELFRHGPDEGTGVKFLDAAAGKEGGLLPGKVVLPPAVSPGGKYVALATRDRLFVVSAADEAVAARLELPQVAPAAPKAREQVRRFEAHGLAFSPDGARLGGLFSHFGVGTRVYWWDLATGVRGGGYKVDGLFANTFQWSADGAAVLVSGTVVLDAATGKKLWTAPSGGGPRRLLTADRLLSAESVVGGQIHEVGLFVLTRP